MVKSDKVSQGCTGFLPTGVASSHNTQNHRLAAMEKTGSLDNLAGPLPILANLTNLLLVLACLQHSPATVRDTCVQAGTGNKNAVENQFLQVVSQELQNPRCIFAFSLMLQ